jgi:hypothetical protein
MKPIDKLKVAPVDQSKLKKEFINYVPGRLEQSMQEYQGDWREDRKEWRLADTLDCIDFSYRRYLKGQTKTLHRVFLEFKRLTKEDFFKGIIVIQTVADIACINEFYELLPKHQAAKNKLLKLGLKLHGTKKDTIT